MFELYKEFISSRSVSDYIEVCLADKSFAKERWLNRTILSYYKDTRLHEIDKELRIIKTLYESLV